MNRAEYNDIDAPYDTAVFERLKEHGKLTSFAKPIERIAETRVGIDAQLARHMAHLFIRDPLVVFSETIDQDDTTSNDHFEVRTPAAVLPAPYKASILFAEHSVDELANSALQTTSGAVTHRLASRVSLDGSTADGL